MGILIGLVGLLVIGGAIGFGVYLSIRSAGQHGPATAAARQRFLQEVGYAFSSTLSPGQPAAPLRLPSGTLQFTAAGTMEGTTTVTRQDWTLTLAQPSTVQLQVVDRGRLGALQALKNAVGPTALRAQQVFPGPHPTGDAALDARFEVYAEDPQTARALIAPAIREDLLACTEVSLAVWSDLAVFSDPRDANLKAVMGSAVTLDPSPMILAAIPVHQRIRRILEAVARGA